MSWKVLGPDNNILQMAEGDFGVALKLTFSDFQISQNDSFDFVIVDEVHGTELVKKTFTEIEQNTVDLCLTKPDSDKLPPGNYVYRIDWYQGIVFMNNLSSVGIFRVVMKA